MSVEDFNNGLIMGLSLQGTIFTNKSSSGGGIEIKFIDTSIVPQSFIFPNIIIEEVIEI